MPSTRCFKANAGIPTRNLGDEIVWLNPTASKLFNGNSTGALIYKCACEGSNEAQIIETIAGEYDGDKEIITRETSEYLDLLVKEGILEEVS